MPAGAKHLRLAIESVAGEWLCPITHQLPLDPVMAVDRRFYEHASIEEWFRRSEAVTRSPVTNEPMGRALTAIPQERNTIKSLVDNME